MARWIRALTAVTVIVLGVSDARAQTQVKGASEDALLRNRPARIGGRPNFNGIWQALNTACWNLEHKCVPFADGLLYQDLIKGTNPSGQPR